MIAAAGLLIMPVLGHNYSTCQSFLGQLAQAGSAQDQATCNFASGARWTGLLVLIAGGVVLAVGVLRLLGSGQQAAAPPCQRCGQPLAAHVGAAARRAGGSAPARELATRTEFVPLLALCMTACRAGSGAGAGS